MIKTKKLKNGARLIIAPMKGTKTVSLLVAFGTGSKHENKDNNGISHFLEHMFFKGTKKRSTALKISGDLDSLGGSYNAFTSKEYTGYWIKADFTRLDKAADVISDMLLNSKFETEEINREKGVIIEELNMYQDNPMMYIEDLFETCLYGDQPAGWDTIGTKKNILNFKRKDFVDYFKSQYGSENAVICLAGNIKKGDEDLVMKKFRELKKSKFREKKEVKENQDKPQVLLHYKKTDQAHLSLGVRSFPIGHKDEHILKAISIILGGSMSSRLFSELRERRGLAYYVRTSTEFYTDSGYLTTQAGVPTDKLNEAIAVIMAEYKKISEVLIKKSELDLVKDLFRGRLAIQLEASDNVASWYVRQEILKGGFVEPDKYVKKIASVTAEDIKRVAQEIFKDNRLNLAIIGPYKNSKDVRGLLKF